MSSISTIIADILPYMFAAIGLEVLSGRIRKLKERVKELESEVAQLKPSEPRLPYSNAVDRQKERTRQFLAERAQQHQTKETD